MDVLTLAGIAHTNAKTVPSRVPSFDQQRDCLAAASVCSDEAESGKWQRQKCACPVPDKVTKDFYFMGPLLFGVCQPSDFLPLWQLNTLAGAKTPGCSQSLHSQLWFHHQPHFQRALLPRSVGGRLWMHSCEAFRQWGKFCAFPH